MSFDTDMNSYICICNIANHKEINIPSIIETTMESDGKKRNGYGNLLKLLTNRNRPFGHKNDASSPF